MTDTTNRISLTLDHKVIVAINDEAERRGTSVEKTVEDLILLALLEVRMGRATQVTEPDGPQESER